MIKPSGRSTYGLCQDPGLEWFIAGTIVSIETACIETETAYIEIETACIEIETACIEIGIACTGIETAFTGIERVLMIQNIIVPHDILWNGYSLNKI